MATETGRTSKRQPFAMGEPFEQAAVFNDVAMDFFSRAGGAYFQGASALNGEVVKFVSTRLNHDAELGQSLAKCRNWNEAAELQQGWVQTTTQEYLAEAGKLFELATKMTFDSWKPLQEQTTKALGELTKPEA